MPGELDQRSSRERTHFDHVYLSEGQEQLPLSDDDKRRYLQPSSNTAYGLEYFFHLLAPRPNAKILEIGCGSGFTTCVAALAGAEVFAYDISPAAVELTRARAAANGVSALVHLQVCCDLQDAFPGQVFDAVAGRAVLHHMPLAGLGPQIHSRLSPGGRAVFSEPVVNSATLAFFRSLVPYRPVDVTEDERPLDDQIIEALAMPFDRVTRREFQFLSRAYPLFARYDRLVHLAHVIDRTALRAPLLRRFASVVVFALDRAGSKSA